LGIRNAARKASELKPAPKAAAIMASRTNPRTRLKKVARATTPAARATVWFRNLAPRLDVPAMRDRPAIPLEILFKQRQYVPIIAKENAPFQLGKEAR